MLENDSVSQLRGVGPAMQQRLSILGIHTINELLHFFPRSYEDRSHIVPIKDIPLDTSVTIEGIVKKIHAHRAQRKRFALVEARIEDDSGKVKVVWFNQGYIAQSLVVGDRIFLTGVLKKTSYGLVLQNPQYEKIHEGKELIHTGRIVPLYNLTQGVTQKQMRYFVAQALQEAVLLPETLPLVLLEQFHLLPFTEALHAIHFPNSLELLHKAQHRLTFKRLYTLQLSVQYARRSLAQQAAPKLTFFKTAIQQFVSALPFTLTNAQRRAAWDILQDMEREHPMNRLLVGDVGSGKTVVAALAMLQCIQNGYQAVLLAPTEILAQQHAASLQSLFSTHPNQRASIALLTGSSQKRRSLQRTLSEANIIVGTHALIQERVSFKRLGLAIVDEQHRFGVEQRKALRERSSDTSQMPHLLSMTATPIPRTLALTLYGDLDVSLINELPQGRKKIITRLVPHEKREDAYRYIDAHVEKGEQAFIICPLIEPSDVLGVKSVTTEFEKLSKDIFPHRTVAVLHGKMSSAEKEQVMKKMQKGEIHLLISTSVIEVGVDVPNATLMMIEGAERFGLAQLHQFRGRVGRSDRQSYCFLFPSHEDPETHQRLNLLVRYTDGFTLAEKDIQLRGYGSLLGKEQTGFTDLALYTDLSLITEAKRAAEMTFTEGWLDLYPQLKNYLGAAPEDIHLE